MPHSTDPFLNFTIDSTTGCWNWAGRCWPNGYGSSPVESGSTLAHRAYFMHYRGEIPQDRVLDHLCCNKPCVNPEHLEPVSKAENGRRGLWALYNGCCRNGHDLRQPGSQYTEARTGRTMCRACREARFRRRDQRRALRRNGAIPAT